MLSFFPFQTLLMILWRLVRKVLGMLNAIYVVMTPDYLVLV